MSTRFQQIPKEQGETDAGRRSSQGGERQARPQGVDSHPRAVAQSAAQERANSSPRVRQLAQMQASLQRKEGPRQAGERNKTGLPDGLKAGLEQLSGMDLSGVRVHRNSSKPAQLNAYAYTQGKDIHVAPGQEKHLPHEGWHVVQQMQGRVRPTTQHDGVAINGDRSLEREADRVGQQALSLKARPGSSPARRNAGAPLPIQAVRKKKGGKDKAGTSFEAKVQSLPPEKLLADDFAFNHVARLSKLRGQTPDEFAVQEGERRGLARHTVLFMDGTEYRALLNEAVSNNAGKTYLKKIQKAGGVPAQTFFNSDLVVQFVTVVPGGNGYVVEQEGLGRIRYTVKNAGKVGGTPIYKINHLQEVLPVSLLETDSAEVPESDSDQEVEDEDFELEEDFDPTQFKRRSPSRATSAPTVQRVIKIGDGEDAMTYSVDTAMDALFKEKIITNLEVADAVEEAVKKFDKEERSFTSLKEMYEAALEDESDSSDDEEYEKEDLDFPLGLWGDEDESLQENDLKAQGYRKGDSLRDEQGLDYKTVDKDAFEVEGEEELALVIRLNRPPGSGRISDEFLTLKQLKKQGLPVASVKQVGFYPIKGVAYPAMLMKRYKSSSKALLRRVRGETQRNEAWKENIAFLNSRKKVQNALDSLGDIKAGLGGKYAVDDIQFLIQGNGKFVINDASTTGSKFLEANVQVIDDLILLLKEHGESLSKSNAND